MNKKDANLPVSRRVTQQPTTTTIGGYTSDYH
jgi:hypothetical protein